MKLTTATLTLCCAFLLFMTSCQDSVSPAIEDSLDLFAGLEAIEEAQSTTVTVNRGTAATDGYFTITLEGVDDNPILGPGTHEAWCLEWHKNLRSNGNVHSDVKWFSTGDNDNWKPLNYLFSIRGELQANDPDLTYRDIQAVVWVLAGEMGIAPEFDVLNLPVDRLPSRLRSGDEPAIDREKVAGIARRVMEEAPEATNVPAGTVAQTAADEQDIFVPSTEFVIKVNQPSSAARFYNTGRANFGPQLTSTGVTADVVLAEGDALACEPLNNFPAGAIALVNRGICSFETKVFNAQNAGAVAVIVSNNIPEGTPGGGLLGMGGAGGNDISIPSLFITLEDGNIIKAGLPATATLRRRL